MKLGLVDLGGEAKGELLRHGRTVARIPCDRQFDSLLCGGMNCVRVFMLLLRLYSIDLDIAVWFPSVKTSLVVTVIAHFKCVFDYCR